MKTDRCLGLPCVKKLESPEKHYRFQYAHKQTYSKEIFRHRVYDMALHQIYKVCHDDDKSYCEWYGGQIIQVVFLLFG